MIINKMAITIEIAKSKLVYNHPEGYFEEGVFTVHEVLEEFELINLEDLKTKVKQYMTRNKFANNNQFLLFRKKLIKATTWIEVLFNTFRDYELNDDDDGYSIEINRI